MGLPSHTQTFMLRHAGVRHATTHALTLSCQDMLCGAKTFEPGKHSFAYNRLIMIVLEKVAG